MTHVTCSFKSSPFPVDFPLLTRRGYHRWALLHLTLATETPGGATEPRGDLRRLQLYLAMCAGPDSDVSGGKGARAVDGTTQSAIPALAGNPPGSQNPSQRHRRPTADNDARVSRRPPRQASERSVLVDAGSSIRANAAASPPGRARSSPISTLPRRQSQTHDGLELEGIRRRASNEAAARCEGSDEDSLTCRCPLDTPHKRRRAPSSSDTDDDATDDDDDDRSPLKRRAAAESLAACPPAPPWAPPASSASAPWTLRPCSASWTTTATPSGAVEAKLLVVRGRDDVDRRDRRGRGPPHVRRRRPTASRR